MAFFERYRSAYDSDQNAVGLVDCIRLLRH